LKDYSPDPIRLGDIITLYFKKAELSFKVITKGEEKDLGVAFTKILK